MLSGCGREGEIRVDAARNKTVALIVAIIAIVAAIVLCLIHSGVAPVGNFAGGSGDSSTGGTYTQPSVPAMSIDPTNLKMGITVTETTPATALATMEASPTLKATPAPGCVNNGQCP
jgi:hypothetical protein